MNPGSNNTSTSRVFLCYICVKAIAWDDVVLYNGFRDWRRLYDQEGQKSITRWFSYKTYIRVMESYRPGPGREATKRTLKSFGYLEDQADPEAFMREVEAYDADPGNREQISSNKMYSGQNRLYNYGYKYLESVYNLLGISDFIQQYEASGRFRGKYSIDEIFKLLTVLRLLAPDSKGPARSGKEPFMAGILKSNCLKSTGHWITWPRSASNCSSTWMVRSRN